MRFGVHVPQLGALAEPQVLVDVAARAEAAGWDGFFLWDHVMWSGYPSACDPWVALGAIAAVTERMVLGPIVTPLPRRRPWKLAREAMTLDRLSGGRTVLGVGIGTDRHREFVAFGEPATDDRLRAEMLDEGLEIITALWRGERVTVTGRHYTVDDVLLLPGPVQQPRVPIWCSVRWPNRTPLRRAARWDGIAPVGVLTPDDVAALAGEIAGLRTATTPFDVVVRSVATANVAPEAYAAAGATWWLEAVEPEDDLDAVLARVDAGPPGTSQ